LGEGGALCARLSWEDGDPGGRCFRWLRAWVEENIHKQEMYFPLAADKCFVPDDRIGIFAFSIGAAR